MALQINKMAIQRFFFIRRLNAESLFLIQKQAIVRLLLYSGILLAVFTSATPWFLWSLFRFMVYLSAMPILLALYIDRKQENQLFVNQGYKFPTLLYFLLLLCLALTGGKTIFGFIEIFFNVTIFYALFRVDRQELRRLGDFLVRCMAVLLSISISFYILYLVGFHLPHHSLVPENFDYTFESYRFFLVDDRFNMELIPRFNSVFLEPSHLGMFCIALLYSQIGKWNNWRCYVLFLAIVMSFSLAAYICMVAMLFSSAWMKGKAVMGKIILLAAMVGGILVGSMFYHRGDNLVNILIVQRLMTKDDGSMEGDNRTTAVFTKEYEKFSNSIDVLWGNGIDSMDKFGFGNAGYRVYIYKNGLISVLALIAFFIAICRTSPNRRAIVSMLIISLMSFVAHGMPTKYYFFIPLYILLFSEVYPKKLPKEIKEVEA